MTNPSEILKEIGDHKLESAIKNLLKSINDKTSSLGNEILLEKSKLSKLKNEQRQGVISKEEAQTLENKLIKNLIYIAEQYKLIWNKKKSGNAKKITQSTSKVRLLMEGNIAELDEKTKENLVNVIAALLKIDSSEVRINRIIEGSIIIELELPEDSAKKLIKLFQDDKMVSNELYSDFKILEVSSLKASEGEASKLFTKDSLIEKVAEQAGINKSKAKIVLDSVINNISKSLRKGDQVSLVGFGTFSVNRREARKGRNPKTGKAINIPAKKIVNFKPEKKLIKIFEDEN